MAQVMEGGYLAMCEIRKGRVNLDDTVITLDEIMTRNSHDAITGQPVTCETLQEHYEKTKYEDRIPLPDRVLQMSGDLFKYLLQTGGSEQLTFHV